MLLSNASVLAQFRHTSLRILITNARIGCISTLAATTTVVAVALAGQIGYPLPFTVWWCSAVVVIVQVVSFLALWGDVIRTDSDARRELVTYCTLIAKMVLLTVVYPIFIFIFNGLSPDGQTAFTLLLPALKVAAKNTLAASAPIIEDLRPEVVTLNADVFHALFVMYSMQSATLTRTVVVLISLDVVSSVVALRRLHALLAPAMSNAQRMQIRPAPIGASSTRGSAARETTTSEKSPVTATIPQPGHSRTTPSALLQTVLYVLEFDANIFNDGSVRLHSWSSTGTRSTNTAIAPGRESSTVPTPSSGLVFNSNVFARPLNAAPRPLSTLLGGTLYSSAAMKSRLKQEEKHAVEALSESERRELVETLLRLLHRTEFMLLVEYSEVVVPIMYAAFLLVMRHLPNRAYYAQLKGLDDAALMVNVRNIIVYALLELVTFLLLSLLLTKKLSISGLRQLAFVLETQWQTVQAKLILWFMISMQSSLEHYGADYSFQFKWLRSSG